MADAAEPLVGPTRHRETELVAVEECERVPDAELSAKLAAVFGRTGSEVPIVVRKAGSRPVVRVGFFVYGMDSVDSVQQTFEGRFQVNLEWRPLVEEVRQWAADRVGFKPVWQPLLYFKNARLISRQEVQSYGDGMEFALYQDSDGEGLLFQKCLEYTVVFNEAFELSNFPFDTQALRILFSAQWEFYPAVNPYPVMAPRTGDGPLTIFDFANVSSEWRLVHGGVIFPEARNSYDLSVCYVIVTRHWQFYVMRVIGVNFIIACVAFATFWFDPVQQLDERVGHLSTCLLTTVAFIFILSNYLPRLPQLTLMDKYIAVFLLLLLWMTLHCLFTAQPFLEVDYEAAWVDGIFLALDGAFLLLWQLVTVLQCCLARRNENRKASVLKESAATMQTEKMGVDEALTVRYSSEQCCRRAVIKDV